MLGKEHVEPAFKLEDVARVNLNVGGLALEAGGNLVDHDVGVGKAVALTLGAGRKEKGAHGGRDTHADGGDVRLDVLHCVVDGEPCGYRAARRVDVEEHVLLRVLRFQKEHLGNDEVCHMVVNGTAEEDDAVLQEARVNVVGALAVGGFFDNRRDEN